MKCLADGSAKEMELRGIAQWLSQEVVSLRKARKHADTQAAALACDVSQAFAGHQAAIAGQHAAMEVGNCGRGQLGWGKGAVGLGKACCYLPATHSARPPACLTSRRQHCLP